MSVKTGKVTVTTENIFPVIRQWLYSDQDIFVKGLSSVRQLLTRTRAIRSMLSMMMPLRRSPLKITVSV